jgi:hypothetical protein
MVFLLHSAPGAGLQVGKRQEGTNGTALSPMAPFASRSDPSLVSKHEGQGDLQQPVSSPAFGRMVRVISTQSSFKRNGTTA